MNKLLNITYNYKVQLSFLPVKTRCSRLIGSYKYKNGRKTDKIALMAHRRLKKQSIHEHKNPY